MIKKTHIIIIGVIAIALIASAFIWKPFSVKGQVIEKALIKTFKHNSLKVNGDIKLSFQKEASQEEPAKNIIADTYFSQLLDIKNNKASTKLNFSVGIEGINLALKAETISTKDEIYLKITSLPTIPFLSGLDLSKIKGQWYKISSADIEKVSGNKTEEENKKILKDLGNLIKGKKIFNIEKNLGEEKVGDTKATHYKVSLDKNSVKKLTPKFLEIMKEYIPENQKVEYEKNLKEFMKDFSKNFDEAWDNNAPFSFDLWSDGLVRRIKFGKKFTYPETNGSDIFGINIDLYFSDFNKKFDITIPKESKPIEDIFLLGSQ